MGKVKFHGDQHKPSLQKKENSMQWYNKECKEAKKLMRKQGNNLFMHLNSSSVTPISEYGVELGALKVSKSREKQTYIFTNLSQGLHNRQQTILFMGS